MSLRGSKVPRLILTLFQAISFVDIPSIKSSVEAF